MDKKGGNLHIGPGPNTLKDEAVNHHSIRPREEENLKPGRDDPPPWIESFVGQRPLAASRASRDERSGRNFLEKRFGPRRDMSQSPTIEQFASQFFGQLERISTVRVFHIRAEIVVDDERPQQGLQFHFACKHHFS